MAEQIDLLSIIPMKECEKLLLKTGKCPRKSTTTSEEFRLQANKLYIGPRSPEKKLELDSIIELYTKSVAYAPTGSRELSLAYANRSAALFKARLYDNCLRDIERALSVDYPDKLKAKLFVRKAQSLMALKSSDAEAERALAEARQWLVKMDPKDREIMSKTLDNSKQLAMVGEPRKLLNDVRYHPEIPADNPKIPGASSAIELKYTKEFGRHFVATRDIEPGEVLLVELPYALVLNIQNRYVRCENCLKQIWSGIPCNYCVHAIYCTEKCREEAWKNHHDVECQVIEWLIAFSIETKSILLPLRLTVKAVKEAGSVSALKQMILTLKSTVFKNVDEQMSTLINGNYASVYTLARTITTELSAETFFHNFHCSKLLTYLLATKSTMFVDELEKPVDYHSIEQNEWTKFISELMTEHVGIVDVNTFEVVSVDDKGDPRVGGSMIVKYFSLFNHSCVPMVTQVCSGLNMCAITNVYVKKNQQIFVKYFPDSYAQIPKSERQRLLMKAWYFECQCDACVGNWPTMKLENASTLSSLSGIDYCYSLPLIETFEMVINKNISDKKMIVDLTKKLTQAMKNASKYVKHPSVGAAFLELNFSILSAILRGNHWQSLD